MHSFFHWADGGLAVLGTYAPARSTTTSAHPSTPTLAIVFAALAVTRFIEDRTGWNIKKFVRTARRYRTVHIRAGQHLLTAEDVLPPDPSPEQAVRTNLIRVGLAEARDRIHSRRTV